MAFEEIQRRLCLYLDPNDAILWIGDRDQEDRWTDSEIAIQLLMAIQAHMVAAGRPAPPPSPCYHGSSMFNAMPWESQQSIGRDLTRYNWVVPDAYQCQSWEQRLFHNTHYSAGCFWAGFQGAILRSHSRLTWATMATHRARYFGIVSRCTECQKVCRIAWCSSSTAHHMRVQRALILSWLELPYEESGEEEDPVPTV